MPTTAGKKVGSITYTEILAPLPIGNAGVYDITILKDDVPFDLTGSTVFFTAKYDAEDEDADAVIKYDSFNNPLNITFVVLVDGTLTLSIDSADTDPIDVGPLFCDIKVEDTLGQFFTHLFFILPICQRITRRETT
jgi:hypothetical protein